MVAAAADAACAADSWRMPLRCASAELRRFRHADDTCRFSLA